MSPKPLVRSCSTPAPAMPPGAWAIQECAASVVVIPRESSTPRVTAGLMWHPEMGPSAYASASRVRPKANATPNSPIDLIPATADPTATKTRRAVPRNSAATERASRDDMQTSVTGRSRSPVLPLGNRGAGPDQRAPRARDPPDPDARLVQPAAA